jgi:hypothetical protein
MQKHVSDDLPEMKVRIQELIIARQNGIEKGKIGEEKLSR